MRGNFRKSPHTPDGRSTVSGRRLAIETVAARRGEARAPTRGSSRVCRCVCRPRRCPAWCTALRCVSRLRRCIPCATSSLRSRETQRRAVHHPRPPPHPCGAWGAAGRGAAAAVAACLLEPACLRRRVCPLSLPDLPALLCLEPRVHVLRRVRVRLAWGGLRAFHSAGGTTHTRKCTGQTAQLMAARTLE